MHILCPHCRYPIELARLTAGEEVFCSACGSSFRLEGDPTTTIAAGFGKSIGHFELVQEIGSGAFGTVWKARDLRLDRTVAVKIPRSSNVGSGQQELDRFLREARSAAQLRHPSIVAVHEVGEQNGVPYLVSDFVEGVTLADLLTAGRPGLAESAKLIAEVADALQYAHSQGVVHRDVKPSNVMIRPDGSPCVMDFGLAKRDAGEVTMTIDGQVLGTPAYMSPEQAGGEGHRVDGRSDVYSLGVILYQLLTGELPFRGNQRMLLHQVLHDEPRSPRSLNDRIPRDLETICLKAMAKEPGRRYASEAELAEDLRHYLKGEPIRARPIGALGKSLRWARRRPAAAALLAVSVLALMALPLAIGGVVYGTRLGELNQVLSASLNEVQKQRDQLEKAVGEAELARAEALKQQDLTRRFQYAADMSLARRLVETGLARPEGDRLRELLARHLPRPGEPDPRGFEWFYLWRQLHQDRWTHHGQPPLNEEKRLPDLFGAALFLPDSHTVLAITWNGTVKRLDARTGAVQQVVATDPPGKTTKEDVQQVVATDPPGKTTKEFAHILLSPDRRLFANVQKGEKPTVLIWDIMAGKQLTTLDGHQEDIDHIAFSPDSRLLVSRDYADAIKVWEPATGKELFAAHPGKPVQKKRKPPRVLGPPLLFEFRSLPGQRLPVAFSPDGRSLAVGTRTKTLQLWDLGERRVKWTLPAYAKELVALSFTPDSAVLVAAAQDKTIRFLETATGKQLSTLSEVEIRADRGFDFTPDGRSLLVWATKGEALRRWDMSGVRSGKVNERDSIPAGGNVSHLWFSPDGKLMFAAPPLKAVQEELLWVWDAVTFERRFTLRGRSLFTLAAAFSPDNRYLAAGGVDGIVRVWDLTTGEERVRLPGHRNAVQSLAFGQDGKSLLSASGARGFGIGDLAHPGEVKLWDHALWEPAGPIRGRMPWIRSSTGRLLATGSPAPTGRLPEKEDTILLWDTATQKIRHTLRLGGESLIAQCFSPDDRLFAGRVGQNKVALWDVETGELRGLLEGHTQPILGVTISPDNKTVASMQMALFLPFDDPKAKRKAPQVRVGPAVNVWDLSTRALRATLPDAEKPRFIGAGQIMLTVEKGNVLVIRDTATGKERSRSSLGDGSINEMKVSPDERFAVFDMTRIVDNNRLSELRCFDLIAHRQQAAFLQTDWDLQTFDFTPDGRFLLSSHGRALNEGGTLKVWDLEGARLVRSWRAHQHVFRGLAVSPDGKRLATAGGEVKLWDLVTYQELMDLPGADWVTFSPDGRTLLSHASGDRAGIRLWRAATADEVKARPDR
jgi:WD40 repeat protein